MSLPYLCMVMLELVEMEIRIPNQIFDIRAKQFFPILKPNHLSYKLGFGPKSTVPMRGIR